MILIADSGSTKTDWTDGRRSFQSKGLSPVFLDAADVAREVNSVLPSWCDPASVSQIHFYGTGCSTPERNLRIRTGLGSIFTHADISVDHDMLGAARSVCQHEPGMVAILGTGANCSYYDGRQVHQRTPSLGFILGDEGSGADIGKHLVIQYFYEHIGPGTRQALENFLGITPSRLIDKIYRDPLPNRFLASLMPFVLEHIAADPSLEVLIRERFDTFFSNHILAYDRFERNTLHGIGSVAFIFKPILEEVAESYGILLGKVYKSPIQGLLQYHQIQS